MRNRGLPPLPPPLPKKSLWRDRDSRFWQFYCPLCKNLRRVPFRPSPWNAWHLSQIAMTSALFTLAAWEWFEWKGVISFLPLWSAFEIFYRLRLRAALRCSHCGFDPYLYLTDVPRARTEIETHWRKKFEERGIPYPEKQAKRALTAERQER